MLKTADQLHLNLDLQLKLISSQSTEILSNAELSAVACTEALLSLKALVLEKQFKDELEEIHFFKKIKPMFSSKLYYYILLYDLERKRIFTTNKSQLEFLENVLSDLDAYYLQNIDFCGYMKINSTFFDDKYFVRSRFSVHIAYTQDSFFSFEQNFTTNRDASVAHLMANNLLADYVTNEIKKLVSGSQSDNLPLQSNLVWKDTKASLTLLIYALHSSASLNSTHVDLQETAKMFSQLFNIDLGNIYRTWAELKIKKDPTKFLDTLEITAHMTPAFRLILTPAKTRALTFKIKNARL